jgi:hypothetical protein
MGRVEVSNDELRTVRDAMRELNRLVDRLERGEAEKFVLTQRNQMRAVVISVDQFTRLDGTTTPQGVAEAA